MGILKLGHEVIFSLVNSMEKIIQDPKYTDIMGILKLGHDVVFFIVNSMWNCTRVKICRYHWDSQIGPWGDIFSCFAFSWENSGNFSLATEFWAAWKALKTVNTKFALIAVSCTDGHAGWKNAPLLGSSSSFTMCLITRIEHRTQCESAPRPLKSVPWECY